MGSRTLQGWLLSPLQSIPRILTRQDGIADLLSNHRQRNALREELKGIADLERLTARARMARAVPRDLASMRSSLEKIPALRDQLANLHAPIFGKLRERIDPLEDLCGLLQRALIDEPAG